MVGTHLLPPNLLKLFTPRPPLPYLPPPGINKEIPLRSKSKPAPTYAVHDVLERIREEKAQAEQKDFEEGREEGETEAVVLCEEEKRRIRREERKRRLAQSWADQVKNYNPQDDAEVIGDPYKTLFVGKIPKDISESEIRRHFDVYGPIERLRLVKDKDGKSKGYCFIVYEREKDMKAAYKDADGLRLKNKRLLIDVERGRTVKNWKPRRLGGGLGGRPKPLAPVPSFGAPRGGGAGGGFRGGRGGFGGGGRGGFEGSRGGYGGGGGRGGGPPRGYGGGGGGGGGGYNSGPPPFSNGGGPPMRGGYGGGPPMRGGYGAPPMRGGYGPPGGGYGPGGGGGGAPNGPPGGFGGPVDAGYGQKRAYDGPPSGSGYDKRPRY